MAKKVAFLEVTSGLPEHKLAALVAKVSDALQLPKESIVVLPGVRLTVVEVPECADHVEPAGEY